MEGMREIDDVPCSSIAIDSTLRIGTAGAIWGLCIGPYDARKKGLTGISRASFVLKSVGRMGLQCGVFAGIYSTTHCGIMKYRRKKDAVAYPSVMSLLVILVLVLQGSDMFRAIALCPYPISSPHTGLKINSSIAGAIAGAAIAARTRSLTQVVGMAALVSSIATAADIVTSMSK